MFSVAPTLGKDRGILQPFSRPRTRQRNWPRSSSMAMPSWRRAARWRSMGRGPSSHPPGKESTAAPVLAAMAPKKTMEDRISRIRSSGISLPDSPVLSTRIRCPSRSTRHPKWRRIATEASTSDKPGQFWSSETPSAIKAAARIGSALFFAPCTATAPFKRWHPSMKSFDIDRTPSQ